MSTVWNLKERRTNRATTVLPVMNRNKFHAGSSQAKYVYGYYASTLGMTGAETTHINYELCYRLEEGFKHIGYLANGWNGYDAIAPSSATIEKAKEIARMFAPEIQPEIQPEVDGSISLHWERSDYNYCLIIFGTEGVGFRESKDANVAPQQLNASLLDAAQAVLDVLRAKTELNHYAHWNP